MGACVSSDSLAGQNLRQSGPSDYRAQRRGICNIGTGGGGHGARKGPHLETVGLIAGNSSGQPP